jgi:hypothetical protein
MASCQKTTSNWSFYNSNTAKEQQRRSAGRNQCSSWEICPRTWISGGRMGERGYRVLKVTPPEKPQYWSMPRCQKMASNWSFYNSNNAKERQLLHTLSIHFLLSTRQRSGLPATRLHNLFPSPLSRHLQWSNCRVPHVPA